MATRRQLIAGGIGRSDRDPPRPWLRIQGPGDASTLWYTVLRRRERDIFMGTLVLRHGDHHTLLLSRDWEEVPIEQIAAPDPRRAERG